MNVGCDGTTPKSERFRTVLTTSVMVAVACGAGLLLMSTSTATAAPDVVGITIGMPLETAEARLRAHNADLQMSRTTKKPLVASVAPFVSELIARTTRSSDMRSETFFLYFSGPPADAQLVALGRVQTFDVKNSPTSLAATRAALIEKYGKPIVDKDDLLLWAEASVIKQMDTPKEPRDVALCTNVPFPHSDMGNYFFPSDEPEVQSGRTSLARCGLMVGAKLSHNLQNPNLLNGLSLMLIDYSNLEQRSADTQKFLDAAKREELRQQTEKAAGTAPKL